MFVQTTPSSAHTAAGFFFALLACGSVNGKCCQRVSADRCPQAEGYLDDIVFFSHLLALRLRRRLRHRL